MLANDSFSNIDEYIVGFDTHQQKILKKVRAIIKKAAPKDATETINYKMPTYRYHGNLIHFAMYKNHLGIYPGSDALDHFKEELTAFKTSKGALQIPLDQSLPEKLITNLVLFNVEKLKDKVGPNWHVSRGDWHQAEELMQQILAQTSLKKEFKWGSDIYTYNGKNVVGWGGFKNFFSIWFYNGVFLTDKENVLISASEGKTKALRQWRFTNVAEMNEKKILAYINESVQTVKEGKEIKPEKATAVEPQGLFKKALQADKTLNTAFKKLTPGKQKEYCLYIEEAKQEKTKESRIEKITPMIVSGIGLHDKYKR